MSVQCYLMIAIIIFFYSKSYHFSARLLCFLSLSLDDPRRPYPQDIEMRSGALGRLKCVGVSVKEEKVDTQLSQHALAG